jgi:hypothetical protein
VVLYVVSTPAVEHQETYVATATETDSKTDAKTDAKTAEPIVDAEAVQHQFIEGVKQAQQTTVDAISTWAETVAKYSPNAAFFPAPKDLQAATDAWFKFNSELLEVQRDFANRVVSALSPLAAKS